MIKKMCPICDHEIKLGHYCSYCRTWIKKPVIRDIGYYLNERHPEYEDSCEYHNREKTESPAPASSSGDWQKKWEEWRTAAAGGSRYMGRGFRGIPNGSNIFTPKVLMGILALCVVYAVSHSVISFKGSGNVFYEDLKPEIDSEIILEEQQPSEPLVIFPVQAEDVKADLCNLAREYGFELTEEMDIVYEDSGQGQEESPFTGCLELLFEKGDGSRVDIMVEYDSDGRAGGPYLTLYGSDSDRIVDWTAGVAKILERRAGSSVETISDMLMEEREEILRVLREEQSYDNFNRSFLVYIHCMDGAAFAFLDPNT